LVGSQEQDVAGSHELSNKTRAAPPEAATLWFNFPRKKKSFGPRSDVDDAILIITVAVRASARRKVTSDQSRFWSK